MPIILLSIRYNMCACRSPIHCCPSGTTCILTCHLPKYHYIHHCYCCALGILYHSCVCRGSVIIELVSRMNSQRGCWVCWKSKKKKFLERGLKRTAYTRYHICLMRVLILLLSIRYNVCVCHNPVPGISLHHQKL